MEVRVVEFDSIKRMTRTPSVQRPSPGVRKVLRAEFCVRLLRTRYMTEPLIARHETLRQVTTGDADGGTEQKAVDDAAMVGPLLLPSRGFGA